MKKCSKCDILKELSEFHKSSKYNDGLDYKCKVCEKQRAAKRYAKTYSDRAWRLRQLLRYSSYRAVKKSMEHTLTLEELEELYPDDNKCPVFDVEFSWGGDTINSPSIDRIDNLKGYTKQNCQVISARANAIKTDATLSELEAVVSFLNKLV